MDPDLVAKDEQNTPYTAHYEAVNAMLRNGCRKVEVLERKAPQAWGAENRQGTTVRVRSFPSPPE